MYKDWSERAYLTFKKDFDVNTIGGNHLSIDVNGNSVTVAIIEGFKLREIRQGVIFFSLLTY